MIISQKIIKNFILYFIVLTFVINILNLTNTEVYNNSKIAEYNQKIFYNTEIIGEKEFCLNFKQPFSGMVVYRELFSISFFMVEASIVFILVGFIFTISKKRIFPKEYRYTLMLYLPIIFLSWAILLGSWMGVVPAFYNCTKYFTL